LELDVPAGQPFTIDFRNADSDPALMHDVDIRDLNGKTIVDQKPIGGGQSVEYHYPGLKAGQYLFICSLHPGEVPDRTNHGYVETGPPRSHLLPHRRRSRPSRHRTRRPMTM